MTARELARRARRAGDDLEQGITGEKLATLEELLDELLARVEDKPSADPAVRASVEACSAAVRRAREAVAA